MKAIDFPFHLAPNGRVAETSSYDRLVRAQVIDAIMTNQGERVMRPHYGCDIQAALFDPADELVRRDAASHLKKRLEQFVSRAFIRSVEISSSMVFVSAMPDTPSEPGTVVITVVYRSTLYATDTALEIPVSSTYIQRSLEAAKLQ